MANQQDRQVILIGKIDLKAAEAADKYAFGRAMDEIYDIVLRRKLAREAENNKK